MLLCLGLIEDALGRELLCKNYASTDNPFILERYEIYRKGAPFHTGVLYLAPPNSLPEVFPAQEDTAIISIGIPTKSYIDSNVHVLALSEKNQIEDLSNEVGRIFFEYGILEQKLQDSVNKGHSIQHMVEIMTPYLNGNEILICNNDYKVIGKSGSTLHLNEISSVGQPDTEGYLPPDIVNFFKNDIVFNKVRDLAEPFFYEPSIFSDRVLCMNVFYRGEYACRIVLAEDANPFRGYEKGLIQFFTSYIQLVYDLSYSENTIIPSDNLADIFLDLLNGEQAEKSRLENSFSRRNWNINCNFHCAVIMPSDRDFYNRTIRYYCQAFNRDIPGCCFVEYSGNVVCIINLDYYGGVLEGFISRTLEVFRESYFRIGYSNKFKRIEDLSSYFLQAKIALKTGLKLNPFHWHHKFSELALPYMEAKLTEELDGRFLCSTEITVLNEYDEKNQSELLKTLKVYLRNQMNAVKTAKELFIHRSTMVYRLERITELTGIDYKSPLKILYLLISMELLLKDG